jgi:hypothetical protein
MFIGSVIFIGSVSFLGNVICAFLDLLMLSDIILMAGNPAKSTFKVG